MKLVLLGTTGYHPNERRQTTGLFLPEIGVAFDAGTSFFRVRELLGTDTLDIFLTHAHLDHVVGLTYLFDILYGKEMERVTVHGEAEKLQAIREHLFSQFLFPVEEPPAKFRVLEEEIRLPDGGVLRHFPLVHPGGAVGYRIDWEDRSFAFVTDTTADPEASYVEAIRGVDVLVHEANFPDEFHDLAEKTGHSCVSEVARVARKAGVGRLVLTHFNALDESAAPVDLNVARSLFPATEIGEDLMEIEI